MKFFSLLVLIGATLALGIVGVFGAKLLLGIMPKSLVVVILAATFCTLFYPLYNRLQGLLRVTRG